MVDLLSRTLDGAGRLRTVDSRAVLGLWAQRDTSSTTAGSGSRGADLEGARQVSQALGVGRYVVGEIVEAGGRLRISARLYGGTAGAVSASVEGPPDSLFGLVDDLTAQLVIREDGPRQLVRTAAATTTSLEAIKAFLTGEELFREGRRVGARVAVEQAIELDSAFAIAWYRLSQLAYFTGEALTRVPDYAGMAHRHRYGLPWRERRLIEANWAYARGAASESDAAFREILRTYPRDVEALFGLALLGNEYGWLLGGPPNRPLEPVRAFLRYEPESFMGRWMLRDAEVERRNCAAADSLDKILWPPSSLPWVDGVAIFCGTPSDIQGEMIRRARDGRFTSLRLAILRVNWISQNPRGAAEFARILDERETTPERRAFARFQLAELELAQGRRDAAGIQFARLASVNRGWALEDRIYWLLLPYHSVDSFELRTWRDSLLQWDAGAVDSATPPSPGWTGDVFTRRHDGVHPHLRAYLLGRLNARLGDHQAALHYAEDLESMTSSPDAGSLVHDLSQSIRAHVLAEEGRFEPALRALESAPREVPFPRKAAGAWAFIQPQERFLRAELLRQLGRHEEALWWYQSVGYHLGSVMAGPSHLRQAEMHEHLGQRNEAIEQYSRFLDLWQDADPEFRPMIGLAERALQRLGGEPRGTVPP
jgi:tetratricopeptide (TPR) repeat protein